MQPLLESQTFRKGILYYAKIDGKTKLRLNFSTRKQDDEIEQEYIEQFIFDGIWLTHIDYQIKSAERRQLTEPNKPIDAFELASRDLPILGFTNIEDLKKQFEIELIKQKPKSQKDVTTSNAVSESDEKVHINSFIQLHLKTRPDSIYKDDYTYVDFWIDKKMRLPAKVIAVTSEEDIYEIKLLNPKVNEKLDEKIFSLKIPKGFTVEILPLESKKSD
jgi:outer membrane lipoprotein-sorting protein